MGWCPGRPEGGGERDDACQLGDESVTFSARPYAIGESNSRRREGSVYVAFDCDACESQRHFGNGSLCIGLGAGKGDIGYGIALFRFSRHLAIRCAKHGGVAGCQLEQRRVEGVALQPWRRGVRWYGNLGGTSCRHDDDVRPGVGKGVGGACYKGAGSKSVGTGGTSDVVDGDEGNCFGGDVVEGPVQSGKVG